MQFKQASSAAGSSALSFYSEAINSKFKEVPKSLSTVLLNCGYPGHSFNSRSGLVDSGNEVQLYKKNLYPQPNVLISTDSSDFSCGAIQNQVKIQGLWRDSWAGTSI